MAVLDCADATVWVPSAAAATGRRVLLDAVTWSVAAGERWAVLGPNGAGKSTLLSLAAAVRHPSSGHVRVLGSLLGRTDLRALRARVGVVDAALRVPGHLTVRDYVLTGITGTVQPWRTRYADHEQRRADQLGRLLGLEPVWKQACGTCSAGERSRARIARALLPGAALLLLDEPAAALDLAGRERLLAALDVLAAAEPELATVHVTHHVEELPAATTHALLLRAGRVLAAGPAGEVLTGELLGECFGLPLRVDTAAGRFRAVAVEPNFASAGGWHDGAMAVTEPDRSGEAKADRTPPAPTPAGIVPPAPTPAATTVDEMTVVVRRELPAPIETVWDLLTDVERMAGLGPEHLEAHWLDPGPALGARFTGRNERAGREWTVTCQVTSCGRPTSFAWVTGNPDQPSGTWSYDLAPAGDARTVVTQTFRHGPGFTYLRRGVEKYPEREAALVAARAAELTANMSAVLAAAADLLGAVGKPGQPGADQAE